jgi:hypothetical protein
MLFFVLFQTIFTGQDWYEEMSQIVGSTLAPTILACLTTYVLLFAKARFYDRHSIGTKGVLHGLMVVFGSGLIVFIISILSNDAFKFLLSLSHQKS